MMKLAEAARATGGAFSGPDVEFVAVGTDTRALQRGALFVALKGPRFDGHNFVRQALEAGAGAALVDATVSNEALGVSADAPLLRVADPLKALGALAAHWRSKFDLPLIGVTGSNGKTSVKEMIAAILRSHTGSVESVLATEGNLNNDIGVPLMLLRLRTTHRYAVIEMGMNHPGEIAYLTRLARPTVALVNNAQAAHLEGMGSVEAVAREKGSIYEGLSGDGIAVINADETYADLWRGLNSGRRVIEFGLEHPAAVSGSHVLLADGARLEIRLPEATIAVHLQVSGMHNARNALAASAAAIAAGVPAAAIQHGLEHFRGVKGRLQRKAVLHGATLIDDTYNANPGSMRAAIDVLAHQPGKKILVLGDMGELGAEAAALHAEIGAYARERGIDCLFCLGDMSRHCAQAFGANARHFERIQELLADLENQLGPEATVLVKGSRFMQMERVVKSFEVAV